MIFISIICFLSLSLDNVALAGILLKIKFDPVNHLLKLNNNTGDPARMREDIPKLIGYFELDTSTSDCSSKFRVQQLSKAVPNYLQHIQHIL